MNGSILTTTVFREFKTNHNSAAEAYRWLLLQFNRVSPGAADEVLATKYPLSAKDMEARLNQVGFRCKLERGRDWDWDLMHQSAAVKGARETRKRGQKLLDEFG